MSRRHAAEKREIVPDPIYKDVRVAKFINKIMFDGKKTVAEKIVYGAFEIIEKKYQVNPFETFIAALDILRPNLQLRSVRIGGSSYQVPGICEAERGNNVAFKWIINAMRTRSENSSVERLAEEIFDTYNKRGLAFKKRTDHDKTVEANRAFAHYSPKSRTKQTAAN